MRINKLQRMLRRFTCFDRKRHKYTPQVDEIINKYHEKKINEQTLLAVYERSKETIKGVATKLGLTLDSSLINALAMKLTIKYFETTNGQTPIFKEREIAENQLKEIEKGSRQITLNIATPVKNALRSEIEHQIREILSNNNVLQQLSDKEEHRIILETELAKMLVDVVIVKNEETVRELEEKYGLPKIENIKPVLGVPIIFGIIIPLIHILHKIFPQRIQNHHDPSNIITIAVANIILIAIGLKGLIKRSRINRQVSSEIENNETKENIATIVKALFARTSNTESTEQRN